MNWTAMSSTGIPFARLAFAGTFLLASAGALIGMAPRPVAHATGYELKLKLDPDGMPMDLEYLGTQWSNGPVLLNHDGSDGRRVQFVHRWPYVDGCWWESTETLEPISATRYRYVYDDRVVSCNEDANEGIPTPRTGIVDVVAVK